MPSIAEQLDQARKNELLDLSLRNPLISYRTLKSRGVDIIDERPVEVYRMLVEEERAMSFLPLNQERSAPDEANEPAELVFTQPDEAEPGAADDEGGIAERHRDSKLQTPYSSERLQRRLLNTYYRARRSIEEEGVNTLYMAFGMLHWYESESSDTERRAPILLVPMELDRTSVQGRFRIRYTGDEIGGNISLRSFLKSSFGISWPSPPDPQTGTLDLQAYFNTVEEVIRPTSRWRIDHHALALGFFSFTRFLMFEDLDPASWPDDKQPADHPMIRRLLKEGFEAPKNQVDDGTHLDQFLDPEDTYQVVDADSSQTRAVLDVKRGLNLVLQGPPGTGKSQTITNIIAEAIGQGQHVLFVSEKMAALEVVKRNLDRVGLGDACLELHSHKTRKKKVLKELERTLNLGKPRVESFSDKASVLVEARDKLNAYAEAVNAPIGESGVRPYQAYGELLQLRDALEGVEGPSVDVPAMKEWSAETYEQHKFLVEQVESHLQAMGPPAAHPFWGSTKTSYLPAQQADIERAARQAATALEELRETATELADQLGLALPQTPAECTAWIRAAHHVLDAPDLSGVHVTSERWHRDQTALEELVEAGQRYQALRREYDDMFIPAAWSEDVVDLRKALAAHGEKWYRWLIGEWRQAKNELAGLCQSRLPGDHTERLAAVDAILDAQQLRDEIAARDDLGAALFRRHWEQADSDWATLQGVSTFLMETHAAVHDGTLPKPLIETLAAPPRRDRLEAVLDAADARAAAYEEAATNFQAEVELDVAQRLGAPDGLQTASFDTLTELYTRCAEQTARLSEIVSYNQLTRELDEEGLQAIHALVDEWAEAPDHLVNAFCRAYYHALLERAMTERKPLSHFNGAQHQQVIERFRTLDTAFLEHNRHQLALKHYRQKPPKSGTGQVGILLHECGKKTRHMPIRQLMQQAGNAIQALKPVFMMSPMSVPKYLPPGSVEFDLVVFDEASQIRPVDAFGAILRGQQTVVVGDSKQLPPTRFFDSGTGGEHDDFEMRAGDQESILDLFRSKGAPERMLRFHYRSKHESLIAVSNKEFYDNDLFIFPSPDADREETGLRYHHLPDTYYDRGGSSKNMEEARIVAERVMEHARTTPHMSLGVATFSTAQMQAVRDQLEMQRRNDPSCEDFFNAHPDEPFFVKNLERVQGDQRDIMFISVGYGYDQHGKLTMNFGPLNRDGGERRLNVLTTRAKYRCEVFTNLRAEDIDLHRTKARGVHVLKEYLSYAATGELEMPTPTGRGPDSPFEAAVADALRQQGYRVEHQIGASGFYIDLAVVDPDRPGQYLLGIECDGATYHSSRTARVRDRTRQQVLESLGWTIHRIWSTDWFRNPDKQLAKAVAAIERAQLVARPSGDTGTGTGPIPRQKPPTQRSTRIARADDEPTEATPISPEPYQKAELAIRLHGGLHEEPTPRLAEWVRTVVEAESPVHWRVVTRRIMNAAGISRMGRRIREAVKDGVAHACTKQWIRREGDILLRINQATVPVRDRQRVDGVPHDIELVPPQEVRAAVARVVAVSYGIGTDDLIAEVARLLGFSRVGTRIKRAIRSVVDAMIEDGALARENGHLVDG